MDNNLPTDDNQKPVTPVDTPPSVPETPSVIPETPEETPIEKPAEPTIEIGSLGQPSLSTFQDVSGKSSNKSKKIKNAVSILGLLLIIVSLPLAVVLVKQRQEIRKEAQMSPGTVTTSDIQNTPIGETLPTTANGSTYSTTFRVTNTAPGSRTVVLQKMLCACPEGAGNPPGLCHNCSTSNETVTLSAGQSIERTLSAHQPSGNVCGSFQLDLTVVSAQ